MFETLNAAKDAGAIRFLWTDGAVTVVCVFGPVVEPVGVFLTQSCASDVDYRYQCEYELAIDVGVVRTLTP